MTPILLTPPAIEPVSLAEAKNYLKIDTDADNDLVAMLLPAARLLVEASSGRMLIEQSWRLVLNHWPLEGRLRLPLAPLRQIVAARVYDAAGVAHAVADGVLAPDKSSDPPAILVLVPPPQPGRAREGIEIDVSVGFGPAASDVPASLRQAILMLVARWFENRGDAMAQDAGLPGDVAALVAPWRRVRL